MTTRRSPLRSLITTKLIIGVTGILLFAYLLLHIAGNLMVFLGRDAFNSYSHALISNPLVVPVEIGLLVVFLIHLFKAIRMTFQNQSARPVKYATKTWAGGASQKSLASSSMSFGRPTMTVSVAACAISTGWRPRISALPSPWRSMSS